VKERPGKGSNRRDCGKKGQTAELLSLNLCKMNMMPKKKIIWKDGADDTVWSRPCTCIGK
jgi:hypothetical protein